MQQTPSNFSLEQTTKVICSNKDCDSELFTNQFHIRKASPIVTGMSKPAYVPIPLFVCSKCGHVNEEFLPKEVI